MAFPWRAGIQSFDSIQRSASHATWLDRFFLVRLHARLSNALRVIVGVVLHRAPKVVPISSRLRSGYSR